MSGRIAQKMNNPLEKLENRFNSLVKLKEEDPYSSRFFIELQKYFIFINDTYPFGDIARSIFSSSSTPSTVRDIKEFYESVISGGNRSKITPVIGLSLFHGLLVENAKKTGLTTGCGKVFCRDNLGNYYYRDKKLKFNKKSIYYHIFDYLYSCPDNKATYSELNTHLAKSGFGDKNSTDKKKERIRNAIKVYEKSDAKFPKTIGEIPVFEVEYGVGLKLNNIDI